MNWGAFSVFIILFAVVTVMGFLAARWQRGDLHQLEEWGLAGRRFGTVVTWFLLGGDLYTAYTFIAVPALVYGAGAMGFFAVPYTIVVFPIMFLVMPRLWSVSRAHGYITAADFVRGRYSSRGLALAVAITGILATLPYIALQLVGMEAVFSTMGLTGSGLLADLPLILAFALLAAYTYIAGLRAPALTAVAKDILIYVTVLVAVILIPMKIGGYGHIFAVAAAALPVTKGVLILPPKLFVAFSTLALGSAFALLLYPHVVTGTLSARSSNVVRRNAALLPVYSMALGFIALLGFMAIAAGIKTKVPSLAVPLLFLKEFPSWFTGFAFAAVAVGALVPAAIMSIAAANLYTRNIYKEYVKPNATSADESRIAKLVSLLVKLGALVFVVFIPTTYAIYLQTLGGIWILQTLPSVLLGLFGRWLHRTALIIGWLVGMVLGTAMAASVGFKTSIYPLVIGSATIPAYAAVFAVLANLLVTVVLTLVFNAAGADKGRDETVPADYMA